MTLSYRPRLRARDLGLPFDGTPGPWNALTDVPGVEVGYCTVLANPGPLTVGDGPVRTGVTAILPRGHERTPHRVWAGHWNLNGNGEMTGTHWIADAGWFVGPILLTNTHSVGIVHHAAVGWMIDQYPGVFRDGHAWAMPIVAETYDGAVNDICGRHVTETHARAALDAARGGALAEGNVGGGTGMMAYEFKGGTGTASRRVSAGGLDCTVAALVQANLGLRHELTVLGVPVGKHLRDNAFLSALMGHEHGSIIVVIATDAPLLPVQLRRLSKRGALGIGRTGSSGGVYSGDLILAFSVATPIEYRAADAEHPATHALTCLADHHTDVLSEAAVQAVEEAILNAMIAAESVPVVKPAGYTLDAIDHERLRAVMRRYGRLDDT